MFSGLVGSTALSARMDPEDLGEVISAFQRCVADTVQRFGGFVAKYMGDGVLVYLVTRKRTRTTLSERCGPGWSRLLQLLRSNRLFRCKPASASQRFDCHRRSSWFG
jgi:class 3 adenylate cyclase